MGVGFFEGAGGFITSSPLSPAGMRQSADLAASRALLPIFFPPLGVPAMPLWVAETRRQIAGCMASVETSLSLALSQDSALAAAAQSLEAGTAWRAFLQDPDLIDAALFAHMRARGAQAVLARSASPNDAWLADRDPQIANVAAGLRLAMGRWIETLAGDAPIRADLPSEHYVELVWLTAALLIEPLAAASGIPRAVIALTLSHAAQQLFDAHDEAQGPIGLVQRLLCLLDDRFESDAAGKAIEHGQHLLFAALAARYADMSIDSAIRLLGEGGLEPLLAICRLSDCSWTQTGTLLHALAAIRGDLDADRILALAQSYALMDVERATALIVPFRVPEALLRLLARAAGARE